MAKVLSTVSFADLAAEMKAREHEIGKLQKKKEVLLQKADEAQSQIDAIRGIASTEGTKREGGRGVLEKNGQPLYEFMYALMEEKKRYTVAELTSMVLEHGYKTNSLVFSGVVRQSLKVKLDYFRQMADGTFVARA